MSRAGKLTILVLYQLRKNSDPLVKSTSDGNEVMAVQLRQLSWKFVPLDKSTEGKEVRAVQSIHALTKEMLSLAVLLNVTAGKEVKLASEQFLQALVKLVPLERFNAGNDSSWVQLRHALEKLTSSSAWVLNVQAPKVSIPLQVCHELWKVVPLDRFKAGNEVSEVQLSHALVKLMSSSASVLNVVTGNDASAELGYQAFRKFVPLLTSQAPHDVMLLLYPKAWEKLVPPDRSNAGNSTIPLFHQAV